MNYETGESFTGPRDYFPGYLARIDQIPRMSAAEEADLLARWRKFQDEKARKRVIEASLHLVPPIAGKQARKFRLDQATEAHKNAAKALNKPLQDRSCFRELVAEGNLALVEAFDAFPVGANVRFEHYARPCIRNAVCRHAVSLLSAVDRPWGKRTLQDVILDPALPDPVSPEDYCGSRVRAAEGLNDTDFTSRSTHKPLRPWPIDPHCIKIEDLPPVLQLRMKGFKLRDIAQELGCSIPTAHRRVKAAIQEVIHA